MNARPAAVHELAALVASRSYPSGEVVVTGSSADVDGEDVVSTASLSDLVEYHPSELTVTVGAGMRISALEDTLADCGQWLPAAATAQGRSAGGLVASAGPGPFDQSYGPVRRHVLGCRVVSPGGETHRWGRSVMKNVAGYDMRALMCGSRGRIGVLTEVTFRVWARPAVSLDFELPADTDPGSPLDVLCTSPAAEGSWRPDSVTWYHAGSPRLTVRLEGTEVSVEARLARLRAMAASRGWSVADSGPRTPGQDGSARLQNRRVYRATVGRDYLPSAVERLQAMIGGSVVRLEAYPLAGIVRVELTREANERANFDDFVDAMNGGERPAAFAVERGSEEDLASAEALRNEGLRRLEARLVNSLGGGRRSWRSDYL